MASVALEQVSKVYPNGTHAVADCTLTVADAELLVLVGPSGCGKSTLLRLVAGLEAPTAGTLRIDGAVVNDLTPQARNVAMVFQDYALYPHMTVRRNLEFPLRMRGLAGDELARRVARTAALLDLGALLDRLPRQLSGGQRQRVAMGRALVREPAVSLLDEPLSNLDAKLRVQVRAEIGDLQRRTRTTMIYVTHDQVEAMTLGERIAVMDRGRLQQIASPAELYARPGNAFVAGFIGNPAMNLFATRLTTERGAAALTLGDARLPLPPARLPAGGLAADGGALTGGIRPEAFRLATAADTGAVLATRVEHVEALGHETLAHVRVGDAAAAAVQLVARLPGMHPLAKGDALRLAADTAQLHLFAADGRALLR
jgi:ABC-type sugar transport system ATPase subunit